ncbi:tetratricopeptide repeat protein [Dyella terrae]|uniref:tetratricopeptide repeat protein n=1 Tax=Dyella terrae TaxID=522259 RepID=UPI001EFCBFC7|nr:tetratricopeptide repeat protein [Dyella terrae]ULU25147.1 sel1 repeat family protein [Dyella terrae]
MMIRAAMLVVMAAAVAAFPVSAATPSGDASRDALKQRAEAGDVQAQVALGKALQDDGVPADKAAGADWYRKAATAGSAEGAWMLGSTIMAGVGVTRDVPTAIEWMRKSVNIDPNGDRMAVLAVSLLSTGGTQEALQWAQKAADKGSSKGMEVLAMARLTGEMGVPKDTALAEKLMVAAAQKGDADAQLSLGQIYLTGLFGRHDTTAGMHWLQTAADSGNAKAEGTLAYFLITGKEGAPVDAARGVALARKAMAANEMLGHYAMGVAYVTGSGIAENPAEGWYQISLAQRMDSQQQLKSAADYLAKAEAKLTTAQLTELKVRVDADAAKVAQPSGS